MTVDLLPNESPEYRRLRAELREAEIALKDQRARVAELRRQLPNDTIVETDYVFREGPRDLSAGDEPIREVRLADLFDDPSKPLVLMHFMYGKKQEIPCPMCTMWADGYNGAVPHLLQRVNFAIVIAGDVGSFRPYARTRGWSHLRIVSAAESAFKADLKMESEDGGQQPGVSVFTRGDDGRIRHFYTGGAMMGGGHFNGMDLLSPVWNILDLTPDGRGEDWFPAITYD